MWKLKLLSIAYTTFRACDVRCGEPSSLMQERAKMRFAVEVKIIDERHFLVPLMELHNDPTSH